jgi:diguanylate cyclase (GGDEF)-like protein
VLTVCAALLLGAFASAPPVEAAARTAQSASSGSILLQPLTTQVNPRALAAGAAAIVSALLLLLYFYRRRYYILYWIAGWILTAVSMLIAAPTYPFRGLALMAYGLSQFFGVVSALAFVISADAYRARPRFRRAYTLTLMPVLIWFAFAPIGLDDVAAAFAPGHLLIAAGLAAAGIGHLRLLRHTWMLGAFVVGLVLLLLGAQNVWLVFGPPHPDAIVTGRAIFLSLALYLVAVLGMQLMTFEDMTYELRRANRRLEAAQEDLRDMVTTDPLTGCRNRRYFDQVIGQEIERHIRYRIPLSLLFVDIDRFKAINDTMGHEAGDRVLQQVAGFLNRNVREADSVFRWGGDEFLILISCGEEEAIRKGEELQAAFAASEARDLPAGVGLSVGCAELPPLRTDVAALVKLADERMYANKRLVRA